MRQTRRQRRGNPWRVPPALSGGNQVQLLQGGDELFAAMVSAIDLAQHNVWLATYIFHNDASAQRVAKALAAAAQRGVKVSVVVDGFGASADLPALRRWLVPAGVDFAVFRPTDRWWRLLQPGQLRRLHQKLCVVDDATAFVGGINLIDDRFDLHHGWSERPRLDFAVALRGPVVAQVAQTARAMFSRARLGVAWRDEMAQLARSAEPMARAHQLLSQLRILPPAADLDAGAQPESTPVPVQVAFVVRDNLRQRRAIEMAYERAIDAARMRIDLACPYFYPGTQFRASLRRAARRGVAVRLLLQGKADYRFAALAAQVLYHELLGAGVRVFEYTQAFLHAKVAVIDADWATVGSSNIDPLSLLLNLEANVIVHDAEFAATLAQRFELALQDSREIISPALKQGWWAVLRRGFVAWTAHLFLRLAGFSGRY